MQPIPKYGMFIFWKCICLLTGHFSLQATSRCSTPHHTITTTQHPYLLACDTVGTQDDDARRARGPMTGPRHKERNTTIKREHQASTSWSTRGGGMDGYKNRRAYKVLPPYFIFSYILLTFLINSRTNQQQRHRKWKCAHVTWPAFGIVTWFLLVMSNPIFNVVGRAKSLLVMTCTWVWLFWQVPHLGPGPKRGLMAWNGADHRCRVASL